VGGENDHDRCDKLLAHGLWCLYFGLQKLDKMHDRWICYSAVVIEWQGNRLNLLSQGWIEPANFEHQMSMIPRKLRNILLQGLILGDRRRSSVSDRNTHDNSLINLPEMGGRR
jgi:hypothetical protein